MSYLDNTLLNKDDAVSHYEEMAGDNYKRLSTLYSYYSKFLIVMLSMFFSGIITAIVQYMITGDTLIHNIPVLILEIIFAAIWVITLCAYIYYTIAYREASTNYMMFNIMKLLHEYGKTGEEIITDKNVQMSVYQSLLTDTRFPPGPLFRILNKIYDGKLNKEWFSECLRR